MIFLHQNPGAGSEVTNMLEEWRGFELSSRCEKITRTYNLEEVTSADDMPLVINTPCYFGYGNNPMPADYWTNPAVMVKYQEDGFFKHLSCVDDDTVPYFMPWFGTGVLASAFGCRIKPATGHGDDPGVISSSIDTPSDIAHMKLPDPCQAGDMPRVIKFMEYARQFSDLPVGLTDINSPLCTAAQICGYDNLFVWMYEEPDAVHELLAIITQTLIRWVKIQKEIIGEPLNQSNGLQGVWSPSGNGIWLSDDDLVSIGPELYDEFFVPHYSRIFETFGGGTIHFCGKGNHQLDNLLNIKNIRAVNNSPMGHFKDFSSLVNKLSGRLAILIQDAAPIMIEEYYAHLLEPINDFRGIMLATFVEDTLGLTTDGMTIPVNRDPLIAAGRIAQVIRACVQKKLHGESLLEGS
jgi:hypothetical protein